MDAGRCEAAMTWIKLLKQLLHLLLSGTLLLGLPALASALAFALGPSALLVQILLLLLLGVQLLMDDSKC